MPNLPILDDDGSQPIYGKSFNLLYSRTINNGLMKSDDPVEDHNTGEKTYSYYPNGIYNQNKIFENLTTKDNQKYTDAQALQNVLNLYDNTRPITEKEYLISRHNEFNLDPRFREQLVQEALASNSNVYSHESEDFVKSIRKSNESYFKEKNLYLLPSSKNPSRSQLQTTEYLRQDNPMDMALSYLINQSKQEKQNMRDTMAYRRRYVPRTKPTQTEQFEKNQEKNKL